MPRFTRLPLARQTRSQTGLAAEILVDLDAVVVVGEAAPDVTELFVTGSNHVFPVAMPYAELAAQVEAKTRNAEHFGTKPANWPDWAPIGEDQGEDSLTPSSPPSLTTDDGTRIPQAPAKPDAIESMIGTLPLAQPEDGPGQTQ